MRGNILLAATISAILIGALLIGQETVRFQTNLQEMHNQRIDERKKQLQSTVDDVVSYVEFMRNQTETRTRQILKSRVNEAHHLASHLYKQFGSSSPAELEELIKESLRSLRFNDDRGYYFATRLDGVEQLCTTCTSLEQKNIIDLQDSQGRYVIRDMIDLVSRQGEGYYDYTWGKPATAGLDHRKLSYIKLFKPLNWVFGTGEYLEDVERDLKRESLNRIKDIRYDKDNYIFVGTWDGNILAGPATGSNMLETVDLNGIKIVRELIKLARDRGGFLEYVMPGLGDKRPLPKISYVKGVSDWQWYIGTGTYIADIELAEVRHRQEAVQSLIRNIAIICVILAMLWLIVLILISRFNTRVQAMLDTCTRFFKHDTASTEPQASLETITIQEFRDLALAAEKIISDRNGAIVSLSEKSAELERYFQLSLDLLCIATQEGYFVRVNPEWEKVLGYSTVELQSIRFLDLVHPEDKPETVKALTVLHKQRNMINFENRFRCKDSSYRWIEWRSRPQGDLIYATARDITQRKQGELELEKSNATFRNVVQCSPMGIHLYEVRDNQLILTGANPAADQLLTMNHSRFINLPIEEIFPSLQETEIPQRLQRAAEHGESWQTERLVYKNNALKAAFELFIFQLSPGRVAVLFNDIAPRKLAEEEQERLQMQLTQAQKMESVGRLAGGVAHDFNNMLGVILGSSELALRQLSPDQPVYTGLQSIRKAAEKSADLTRQLLAFARRQTVSPQNLDLNKTVAGMLSMLQRLIGEDIELVWLPGTNLQAVHMDPSQIDQILVNLCVNARDAIGYAGRITIETRMTVIDENYCRDRAECIPGDYVQLSINDNGMGMDKDTIAHIFEPFFTTKSTGRGTGLGLATVYGIIKQNNGYVYVYSETGIGTTLNIYLPTVVGTSGAAAAMQDEESSPTGNETVLLVEDELQLLDLTRHMLEESGYRVLSASSPAEAIALAHADDLRLDLLLTDVVMPEMHGKELAEKLAGKHPHLKTVFMSGYTADVIAQHGLLKKDISFLQKPFSSARLLRKLRDVLDGGSWQERN